MADRPGKTWRWEMPWLVSSDAEERYLRPVSKRLLSLALLWLTGAGAPSVAGVQQPESPVSFIDIPLRLSLEPLISAADKLLPNQAGNWRSWKDWHGIPS